MGEMRNTHKILVGNLDGKKPLMRHRLTVHEQRWRVLLEELWKPLIHSIRERKRDTIVASSWDNSLLPQA
jgi:hypothetical protein